MPEIELNTSAISEQAAREQGGKPASARADLRMGRADNESGIIWVTTIFMAIFHLGAIAALFFFSWINLIFAFALYVLAINCGIGMGYHRLLVHRGYQVPGSGLSISCRSAARSPLKAGPSPGWRRIGFITSTVIRAVTRTHPREGTWWAHMGWIITGRALNAETATLAHYAPDLAKDRFHVLLSKYHWVPLTALAIGLLAVGTLVGGIKAGVGVLLWGIFLRVTLGLHATWLVNSATHMIGGRRFETRDESRNSWWVALLTGGEGWHNNHHAYPVSARHGLAWYEFDLNYYGIWLLRKLGLAKHVRIAKFARRDPDETGPRSAHMTTL